MSKIWKNEKKIFFKKKKKTKMKNTLKNTAFERFKKIKKN